jgi:hypothetical protein
MEALAHFCLLIPQTQHLHHPELDMVSLMVPKLQMLQNHLQSLLKQMITPLPHLLVTKFVIQWVWE